jgi:Outer membrane cobalamin receptor protein
MLRTSLSGLAAITLAFSAPALAQTEKQQQEMNVADTTVLDTVVVTAGRSEEQIKSLSVAVTVITEKDIERAGAQTLPDLLKQQGITLRSAGAGTGSGTIAIRGFTTTTNPNESGTVLIMLDGRRIGNNDIGFIPLQNIGRVEIIRGAASVQYGSEATGGVINLISKRGGEKFEAFAEQSIGSRDRYQTQAGFSGEVGKLDYSLGGSYYTSGDADVGGGKGRYLNTATDGKFLGGLNVGYNFNEDHRLGLVASITDGTYGRSGAYTGNSDRATNPYGQTNRSNYSWDLRYEGGLPDANLTWMARYYQGKTIYETASNWNTKAGYYEYTGEFEGASLSGNWNNGLLYVTGGLDYYKMEYTKTTTPPPTAHQYDYAGFLLAKLAFLDDTLWFNGGLRYDQYDIESGADASTGDIVQSLKQDKATYSFGVSYLPLDWLKLRTSYSTSFKMPEPISQMRENPCSGATCIHYRANSALKPESSKGWEVGSDVYYGGLTWGLTYFNVDYENKIESAQLSPPVGGRNEVRQYQNLSGQTEYRGLEASFA